MKPSLANLQKSVQIILKQLTAPQEKEKYSCVQSIRKNIAERPKPEIISGRIKVSSKDPPLIGRPGKPSGIVGPGYRPSG